MIFKNWINTVFGTSGALTGDEIPYDGSTSVNQKIDATAVTKASQGEVDAGTDDTKFVTPLTLENKSGGGGGGGRELIATQSLIGTNSRFFEFNGLNSGSIPSASTLDSDFYQLELEVSNMVTDFGSNDAFGLTHSNGWFSSTDDVIQTHESTGYVDETHSVYNSVLLINLPQTTSGWLVKPNGAYCEDQSPITRYSNAYRTIDTSFNNQIIHTELKITNLTDGTKFGIRGDGSDLDGGTISLYGWRK